MAEVIDPRRQALADEGTPYRGFLYAGLMLTDGGHRGSRVQLPAG